MYYLVLAQRTMIHKQSDYNQKIPNSRTLTAVYDSILDDLIMPAEVIGKRIRVSSNGKSLHKVYLDIETQKYLGERKELIEYLYKELTDRKLELIFQAKPNYLILKRKIHKRRQTANNKPSK